MSCGIVDEEEVRSVPIREDVPWKTLDEVKLVPRRHGDRRYWVIEYFVLGPEQPPLRHSAWRNATSARSFLHLNSAADMAGKE